MNTLIDHVVAVLLGTLDWIRGNALALFRVARVASFFNERKMMNAKMKRLVAASVGFMLLSVGFMLGVVSNFATAPHIKIERVLVVGVTPHETTSPEFYQTKEVKRK
jgi:hypothetical protein